MPDTLLRYSDSRKANIELDLVGASQFSFARFIWKHDCNLTGLGDKRDRSWPISNNLLHGKKTEKRTEIGGFSDQFLVPTSAGTLYLGNWFFAGIIVQIVREIEFLWQLANTARSSRPGKRSVENDQTIKQWCTAMSSCHNLRSSPCS